MVRYKNLRIIGTSHIAIESIKKVEETILNNNPSIVAVELDANRLHALKHKISRKISIKDISRIGVVGYLFALIGQYVQKKLGAMVKAEPGEEMLMAVGVASKIGARVALVDQNISITLAKLSKKFSFKEKMNVFKDILKFVFFKKKAIKSMGLDMKKFDLSKVPTEELIEKMMKKMRKRYPNLYKVLVTERNEFMGKRLIRLMKQDEKGTVVAVVGAGHSEGLLKYIKNNINKVDFI